MQHIWKWGLLSLFLGLIACGLQIYPPTATPLPAPVDPAANAAIPGPDLTEVAASIVVGAYDPSRDPAKDVQAAIPIAQAAHKHILLEVGGDWCVWCHIMDSFHDAHPDLLTLRTRYYVLVKVNMSDDNENKPFLSQYPEIPGYPHLFVLDSDGKLVHSQNTSELEQGESYNLEKFKAFYQKWSAN